jgi:hypothetical protein
MLAGGKSVGSDNQYANFSHDDGLLYVCPYGSRQRNVVPLGTLMIFDWATTVEGRSEFGPRGPDPKYLRPIGSTPDPSAPQDWDWFYQVVLWIQGFGKVILTAREGSYVGQQITDLYGDYSRAPEAAQGLVTVHRNDESVAHNNTKRGRTFYSPRWPRVAWRQRDPRFGPASAKLLLTDTAREAPVEHKDDDLFDVGPAAIEAPAGGVKRGNQPKASTRPSRPAHDSDLNDEVPW